MNYFIFGLILLYTISLVFYFMDIINRKYLYGLWGKHLLLVGGLIQSFIFILEIIQKGYFPLLTMFEVLFFYSLILIVLTVTIHYIFEWKILEASTILLAAIFLIGAISVGETTPSISNTLLSNLIFVHILFAVISYIAFFLSAIFSLLFIINDFFLKRKIWNVFTKAIPSLESLERNAYYANLIGVSMLLIGLIIGSIWASLIFKWTFFLDPKVITSFIILSMYSIGLIERKKKTWMNKELAIWNLLSFFMVVINFSVANIFESFHRFI